MSIVLITFALFVPLLPLIFLESSSILSRSLLSRSTLRRFSSVMTVIRQCSTTSQTNGLYAVIQVFVPPVLLSAAVSTAALASPFILSSIILVKKLPNYAKNSCTAKKVLQFEQKILLI